MAEVKPFVLDVHVDANSIDANGHVNNVDYLRWMLQSATAHADASGCTTATFEDGATWFVRSHFIEYLRPALAGDHIEVRTWVAGFSRASSLRQYVLIRVSDGATVATGKTDWVYVNSTSGKPRSIPAAIRELFGDPALLERPNGVSGEI